MGYIKYFDIQLESKLIFLFYVHIEIGCSKRSLQIEYLNPNIGT